ncbi:MAG: hypothetical protein ORN98_10495 [Alphaproteobacteria bacterium]|nr:hypothetical protein [Alphaproteobacteria bacterium]
MAADIIPPNVNAASVAVTNAPAVTPLIANAAVSPGASLGTATTPSVLVASSSGQANAASVPPPLPPATSLPARLVAVALAPIPDWFDHIGQVTILPAQVAAVNAEGEASFETPAGTLSFTPNTPLTVGSTVRLLIEQKPIAQVTILNDAVMPPPIRFNPEITPHHQAVASWPPPQQGEFLVAQVMSMPRTATGNDGALINLTDAATRQIALQALHNATDPIRGMVSNSDRASTIFLSSLLGQTADPILQILALENGAAMATGMEGAGKNAMMNVSPLAISTTTEGLTAPVTLLPGTAAIGFHGGLAGNNSEFNNSGADLFGTGQNNLAGPNNPSASGTNAAPLLPIPPELGVIQLGDRRQVQIISITPPQPSVTSPTLTSPTGNSPALGQIVTPGRPQDTGNLVVNSSVASAPSVTPPPMPLKSDAASPQNFLNKGLVDATVVGVDQSGQTVVSIGSVLLTLPVSPPPLRSQIILAWNVAVPIPSSASIVAEDLAGWISKLLLSTAGSGAQSPLSAIIPGLGPNLAAQLALYVQAADRKDIRALVSATTEAIIDGKTDAKTALEQIRTNFAGHISGVTEESGTPWRSFTIPLHLPSPHGGPYLVQPIKLALHGANPESEQEKNAHKRSGPPGVRFVVDLDFTRLGAVQLDGLARERRLDLVIRTPALMAEPVRQGISEIFTRVATAYGIQGQTLFQVAPKFEPPLTPDYVPRALPKLLV